MTEKFNKRTAHTAVEAVVAVVAILAAVLFFASRPAHAAAGDITAVFGTVLKVDAPVVSLATDDAVVKMSVDGQTVIKIGDLSVGIGDLAVGDRIAATAVEQSDGTLLGKSVLVRPRDGIQVQHVVGIVIAAGEGKATVLDRDGNTVTFDLPAGGRVPDLGEAITAVTRRDVASGRIEAKATERAQQVIERLEEHLDELQDKREAEDVRRADRLRQLLQENTQRHLSALAEAAGKVKANQDRVSEKVRDGAREKLEAARARYAESAAKHGVEIGDIQVEGTIAAVFEASVTLQLRGGGEVDFSIGDDTHIVVKGVENPTVADIEVGAFAVVDFDADADPDSPVASKIKVSEPKLSNDVAANLQIGSIDYVDGMITHVELDTRLDDIDAVVIVLNDERGAKVAVKVTSDTSITVNGTAAAVTDLKAGLRAAISLEDGLVAVAIRAYTPNEGHRNVEGVIRKIDAANRIVAIAPAKGQVVVVSVADDGKIDRDGHEARFEDLQVNDLVLAGTRFDKSTGEIVRLIARSPKFTSEGVVAGISQEEHIVSIRPRNGDSVRLMVTNETKIMVKGGAALEFADLKPGLHVAVAWRAAVIDGVVRNLATSIVVIRSEFETVQGVVAKVDAAAGVLVVETKDGRIVELHLPAGDRKAALVKDGHRIESLRPVEPGDEVRKAVFVLESETLISLDVVTPGAKNARGQLVAADAAARTIKIAISKDEALTLAVTPRSVFTFKGENVAFERLAGNHRIALVVLYLPGAPRAGADGTLLSAEAILLGEPDKTSSDTAAQGRVEVDVAGVIRLIDGDVWVINDVKFKVIRGTTRIEGTPAVGALAKAHLVGERGGDLVARAVGVQESPAKDAAGGTGATGATRPTETKPVLPGGAATAESEAFVVTGVIQRVDRDVWLVRDQKFIRNARSVVHGEPRVGAVVKMAVRRAEDGTLVILEASVATIEVSNTADRATSVAISITPATDEQVLEGAIDHVDGDVLVVSGLRVLVLPHVLEKREAGMKIKCSVRKTDRAVLEAVRCVVASQLEPAQTVPEFKTFTGTIAAIDGHVWVIAGRKFPVAADAKIDGRPVVGARVKAMVRVEGDTLVIVVASIAVEASASP